MSAEPKPTTTSDAWTKWQNQVVDGRFTLRRFLGGSDRGAVFLTEHKAKNLAEAAIKLVRADASQAKTLLVHWQAAMALSHPHLVQIFEVGRWQSGGNEFLFVVMEYGDQTLAEILSGRALSAEETLELLPPVLDALTFLHRRQLVHGRLQPSNLLAVGDQLKLASDTVRRAGEDQGVSTTGDIWNLGATLVEALTRRVLTASDHSFDTASLPAGLPVSLVETVRRCLAPTLTDRPSVIELRAEYRLPAAAAEPTPASKPAVQKVSSNAPPQPAPSVSQATAVPQPAPVAPRAAVPSQSAPAQSASSAARETHVPQQAPTPSRTNVPPQSVPSALQAGAPPQPASIASRVNIPTQPTSGASQTGGAPQSAPSTSQASAAPQSAPGASRTNVPPQPVPIASQASSPPQPASIAPQVNVPTQPTSGASQAGGAPRSAPSTAQASAAPQSAPSASRPSAPPQPTSNASQVNVPTPSAAGASRTGAPPQSAPSTSQASAPSQPAAATSRASALLQPAPGISRVTTPPQPAPVSSREEPPPSAPKRHLFLSGIAAALLLLLAIWGGSRFTNESQPSLQTTVVQEPTPAGPSAPPQVAVPKPTLSRPIAPAEQSAQPPAATSSSVLNEVLPTVPDKIRNRIQGRVYVTVRVLVDPNGKVIGVLMENAGPSKYFARLSDEAARQWQFISADTQDSRVWLIRFQYTRDGVAIRTTEQ